MGCTKKKARPVAIALDLGGTDLKSGVLSESGKILHQNTTPSESQRGKKKVLEKILSAISQEEIWAKEKGCLVKGVGLGIPGIISYPQGVVHRSPHFPDWKDLPLKSFLKKHLGLPFVLDNDANMATLGEAWKGAGKGCCNFILLTLGTGIGGGILLNQKIFRGDSGFAGECGHLVIDKEGLPCACGGRGCLEMYASASGIQDGLHTPEQLFDLASRGNKKALRIYQKFGEALGTGIASLVNILDIELILLGGGLSGAWQIFIPSTRKAIQRHTYPTTAKKIQLKNAALGNDAGLMGAARAMFIC